VEAGEPAKTIDLGTPGERQQAEVPELGLSEDVFADQPQAAEDEPEADEPEAAGSEREAAEGDAGDAGDEPAAEAPAPDPGDGTADEG
jgi:hypothetical protein